jgi:hypothetical protein
VVPGLPSGGLAAGGGAPSRGEGEVAGVGGEGARRLGGGGGGAGRPPAATGRAAHPPRIGPARAGGCEGEG